MCLFDSSIAEISNFGVVVLFGLPSYLSALISVFPFFLCVLIALYNITGSAEQNQAIKAKKAYLDHGRLLVRNAGAATEEVAKRIRPYTGDGSSDSI